RVEHVQGEGAAVDDGRARAGELLLPAGALGGADAQRQQMEPRPRVAKLLRLARSVARFQGEERAGCVEPEPHRPLAGPAVGPWVALHDRQAEEAGVEALGGGEIADLDGEVVDALGGHGLWILAF